MPQETIHMFIQEGSTKEYQAMERALHRICDVLKLGKEGDRQRTILSGDEETYGWVRRYCQFHPEYADMLFLWPGDFHIPWHLAKAVLKRN